jgi:dephospho-CoA kinase
MAMIVIGLTGGIGSGKSTVAGYLAGCGAAVIDADKVGHEVFRKGTTAYQDVINTFGLEILDRESEIDRKKLGKIVFDNQKLRNKLNHIMWSRIWEMINPRISEFGKQGFEVVVVEAFGFIEAGWHKLVDQVWVTVVPEKLVIERLKEQRGLAEGEIKARIKSQLSTEERNKYADVVILNDGTPEDLREKVQQRWQELQSGKYSKK